MKVWPPLEIEPATSNAGGIEGTIGLLGRSLEEDLEAAEMDNWFTDNLINSCLSEIISHNEHTIESSHYYDEYIVRGHHDRNSKRFLRGKDHSSIILPVHVNDSHWITVVISCNKILDSPSETIQDQRLTEAGAIPVSSNATSFTIISQNINGKYTEATNNLDIENKSVGPHPAFACTDASTYCAQCGGKGHTSYLCPTQMCTVPGCGKKHAPVCHSCDPKQIFP